VTWSLIPTAFVWLLPVLSKYFPEFVNPGDQAGPGYMTVSGFISKPPATGAMGTILFFVFYFMWEAPIHGTRK